MTERERLIVAVGLVSCTLGATLVVAPGLGTAALPRTIATLLTVCAGFLALAVAAKRLVDDGDPPVDLPSPERRPRYAAAGAALRDRFEDVGWASRQAVGDVERGTHETSVRERMHAELRDLAVDVLTRTEGYTVSDAVDGLRKGRWTDDEEAAAFFVDGPHPPLSRRQRLSSLLGTDPPFVRRGRHVVAALSARVRDEAPGPDARLGGAATRADDTYWLANDQPVTRSTRRTSDVTVAVLLVSVVGVFFGHPGMVLVATFGMALTAAARVSSPSVDLELTRAVDADRPDPDEAVTVTVTVRNAGESTLPDLRVLDGVPAGLRVTDGSPRFTTALRPGRAATFSYEVTAVEGRHAFEPALAVVGDFAGATETVTTVDATSGPTVIDCGFDAAVPAASPPRRQVAVEPGSTDASVAGAGVEFDSVREYRPGDPPSRIDWNRLAKTGTLSTVDFLEPRLASVVLVVDARRAAYVASERDGVPAARLGALAAFRYGDRLLADGRSVGVATTAPSGPWVPPRTGSEHRVRVRRTLAGADAVSWVPPGDSVSPDDAVSHLAARLPSGVQVVLFSPLCDDEAPVIARLLDVTGHRVTVVSPDCTDVATVEAAHAHLRRWRRLSELRRHAVPVWDWRPDDPFEEVVARADRC